MSISDSGRRGVRLAGQCGVTLIELVMFIIIVGIAVAGILLVYTNTVRYSADPVIRKQMVAIGEAMLEETRLMPFTYCDPNDANAATAGAALVGAGNCATTVESIGPEAGETRYTAAAPFDNVNDYAGFDTATATPMGIADLSGAVIGGLAGYQAQVSASAQPLGPGGGLIAAVDGNGAPQVLLITVTVTASGADSVSLSGYRTRYAPNAVP
jgi:MSHA pilin protein MshD